MKNNPPIHILVMRFSAFGDVAMTIPVIQELIEQNPSVKITFLSRAQFQPLLIDLPNVRFISADLKNRHKGILGLFKLYRELKKHQFDAVADLHNVLRTQILRTFFVLDRVEIAFLNKGRNERKALLRKENKLRKPIKPMAERYADVFRTLGFDLKLSHRFVQNSIPKQKTIGIAPFAMYKGKMYPIAKMRKVAQILAEKGIKVYLFGGRSEAEELKSWESLNPHIESVVGKLDLKGELELIRQLKLMISMDSANMHLASLVGVPVVSIWGNTHPFMGFLGYGQSMDNVIQDESFLERPTSVFGKEKSNLPSTDFFQNITPEDIVKKVESLLK